jgi:hypothetical protein
MGDRGSKKNDPYKVWGLERVTFIGETSQIMCIIILIILFLNVDHL